MTYDYRRSGDKRKDGRPATGWGRITLPGSIDEVRGWLVTDKGWPSSEIEVREHVPHAGGRTKIAPELVTVAARIPPPLVARLDKRKGKNRSDKLRKLLEQHA